MPGRLPLSDRDRLSQDDHLARDQIFADAEVLKRALGLVTILEWASLRAPIPFTMRPTVVSLAMHRHV
jgi:hypothetical protein